MNEDKEKTVNSLKKLAKAANEVWIATDEDRE
ncbi:toprim domain-containing protein [Patescibacteria group bacterium]